MHDIATSSRNTTAEEPPAGGDDEQLCIILLTINADVQLHIWAAIELGSSVFPLAWGFPFTLFLLFFL
ncbi:Protein of unknown function [Pyronema omphalodes CBS 100304]|uniref:Uncharacterized protein n=1 Tax=Pyronema omphalodes (strain CBS 100304) TaxID=1076935 RepID=U4LQR3_PYROM|nr:Protein of unknown function [Pyronema omphalodes CBS 100304]